MHIAVTGGTGFVGRVLLDMSASAGHQVSALTRRPQLPAAGVSWFDGDLASASALEQLVAGADVVIHLAGTVSAIDRAQFTVGNVAGTRAALETASAAGVGRFIFVSTLAAREPRLSSYGASKAEAEKLVRESPLPWTIVRPPAVYGPGDREMFELFRAATWGVVPMPRRGSASLIHVADLARLLLVLAEANDEVTGQTFEPDDGRPGGWPHAELGAEIGRAVGRTVRVAGLPGVVLQMAARADTLVRGKRAKLTPDRAGYMSHPDWVVSPAAAVPGALWHPRIPTPKGLRDTAHWYRGQGWL